MRYTHACRMPACTASVPCLFRNGANHQSPAPTTMTCCGLVCLALVGIVTSICTPRIRSRRNVPPRLRGFHRHHNQAISAPVHAAPTAALRSIAIPVHEPRPMECGPQGSFCSPAAVQLHRGQQLGQHYSQQASQAFTRKSHTARGSSAEEGLGVCRRRAKAALGEFATPSPAAREGEGQMEPSSNEAWKHGVFQITFAHSAQCGLLSYVIFARWSVVSRKWRDAVGNACQMLVHLDFRGHEARVTGFVVRCALERIAGPSLRSVDLADCRGISGPEAEEILDCIVEKCPKVEQMDLTGCTLGVAIRTFAVRARNVLGAASPLELYKRINKLQEGEGGDRIQFEDLRLCLIPGPHIVLEGGLQGRVAVGALESLLLDEARQGSGWAVALVLSVKFDDIACTPDAVDNNGCQSLHLAASRGDEAVVHLLVCAGANITAIDIFGSTPLLAACRAGNLKLAEMLVNEGAEVSAADDQGDTPLLAALVAGNVELAEILACNGADVTACRSDGAGMLALAIVSGKDDCVAFAIKHGAKRLKCRGNTTAGCDYIGQLTQAFLDPMKMEDWLHGGASPSMLIGEIGALMYHDAVASAVKEQLSNVRAFLSCHIDVLQDPSRWPVPHFVQQLAAQEPDSTFARASCSVRASADGSKTSSTSPARIGAIIEWVKPQLQHPLRLTLSTRTQVRALAVSPTGVRLAHAVSNEILVRDTTTGFTLSTLRGHTDAVNSLVFMVCDADMLASGSHDSTVKVWNTVSGVCLSTLKGHTSRVTGLALDPQKPNILVSRSWDETIKIWDVTSESCLSTVKCGGYWMSYVTSIAVTGNMIAAGCWCGSGPIKIFTLQQSGDCGEKESILWGHRCTPSLTENTFYLIFSTDSVCLSSDFVNCVAFNPRNRDQLVSASDDKCIKMWKVSTSTCVSTVKCGSSVNSIAFKDKMIVAGCASGEIKIFTFTQSGDCGKIRSESSFEGVPCFRGVLCVTLTGTANTIVAGCWNGKILFFDTAASQVREPPPSRMSDEGHGYAQCR